MRQILLATRNQTKLLLLGPVLEQHGFEVLTLRDLREAGPDVEENGHTPLENARAKARRYHAPAHPWVLGQDAGLEVDALGGEPGVQVRRWGGRFPDDVDDRTWLAYLLGRMRGVPPERRTARFIDARVLIAPDGSEHEQVIHYPFRIAAEQIRPIPPGAPISAVMVGPADLIQFRAQEVVRQFEEWGVLVELLRQFPTQGQDSSQ